MTRDGIVCSSLRSPFSRPASVPFWLVRPIHCAPRGMTGLAVIHICSPCRSYPGTRSADSELRPLVPKTPHPRITPHARFGRVRPNRWPGYLVSSFFRFFEFRSPPNCLMSYGGEIPGDRFLIPASPSADPVEHDGTMANDRYLRRAGSLSEMLFGTPTYSETRGDGLGYNLRDSSEPDIRTVPSVERPFVEGFEDMRVIPSA